MFAQSSLLDSITPVRINSISLIKFKVIINTSKFNTNTKLQNSPFKELEAVIPPPFLIFNIN